MANNHEQENLILAFHPQGDGRLQKVGKERKKHRRRQLIVFFYYELKKSSTKPAAVLPKVREEPKIWLESAPSLKKSIAKHREYAKQCDNLNSFFMKGDKIKPRGILSFGIAGNYPGELRGNM